MNRSTCFQVFWRCLFVVSVFFVCIPHSSDGNEELENTLRCSLLGKFDKKCRLDGPELNHHMIELLKRSPAAFRAVLRGQFADLNPTLVGKIPLGLVYLLPTDIWSRVEPKVAFELIRSHRRNEAVARSVMRGYAKATLSNKNDFLRLMDLNRLDRLVVSIMASEISSNWSMNEDAIISRTSPPFFVALPEASVLEMEKRNHVAMLNEIVGWDGFGLSKERWFDLPAISKRVWAIVGRNYTWNGSEKRTTTPLLAGATPSELQQEAKSFSEYELMKLPLKNRLQIRALFPIARPEEQLGGIDLSLLKRWFLFLSPDQILRFKDDLEFMHVVKEKQYDYWAYPSNEKPFVLPSVPTLRQIIEITTVINNERQILPLDPTTWEDGISIFGPLTFLIGARRLGKLEPYHKPLELRTLKDIDSYRFSKRMARHLMFNSKHILKVRGLLKGVSTGSFLGLGESGINGMDDLREVVQNIPAEVPARTALVFRKIRENLGVVSNLEAILRNPNPEQFMSLLTLKETSVLYKALVHHWTRVSNQNLVDKIQHLPESVLSNFLSAPRMLNMELNPSGHIESKSIAGLTCDRLLAVDTTNVPEMIAAMRHARKKAGKTDMSKKLQRCARIALDKYLIERASSTFASKKAAMSFTASAIKLVDIENFGGFVLATYPPNEIESNPYAKLIMKKIGSLSVYELISAIPCYKCLQKMAETAVIISNAERNITFSNLVDLGSLVGFLPPNKINVIHPAHWRITAEAASLDGSSQPLCVDEESRDAWEKVIRSAFGPPEQWKAGTLASIGTYMPTLLENTLQSVPLGECASAGDTMGLTGGAPYLQGVESIGYDHPRPFWKVCRDLLDRSERKDYEVALRTAARFQLNAAEQFANKVKNADALKELRTKYRQTNPQTVAVITEAPHDLYKQVDVPLSTTTTKSTSTGPQELYKQVDVPSSTTTAKSTTTGLQELYKQVDVPPSATTAKSTSIRPPLLPHWSNSVFSFKKDEVEEPKTPKPRSSEDKKLEFSSELADFIDNFYEETKVTTTVGTISTELPNGETTAVTEAPEESVTYSNEGMTEASILFVRNDINKPTSSSSSSQVYVDQENYSVDKTDNSSDPSADLKMKMDDVQKFPAAQSTPEPPKKTNGTVYSFPALQSIPELPTSDPVVTDVAPTVDTDDTLLVTPSPILPSTSTAGNPVSPTTSDSVKSDKSAQKPQSTTPMPSPSPLSLAANLNSTMSSRRRRQVNVQAHKTPLTCDGLLTMGPAASLALSSSDIDMPCEEFEDCVEFIGKLELSKEVAQAFWKKLKMAAYWNTIADIGCLAAGMTSEDVKNLNLDIKDEHFLDTISTVSLYADKDVVKAMVSKLKSGLDKEIASGGKIILAEEIALALGQDMCYLTEDTRSHLANTPNVLVRSLSGMNKDGFFEQTFCRPECLQGLLKALVNQNQGIEWTSEDNRNAGVIVAGFSEGALTEMSGGKSSQMFAEMSASAVRCLSETQLKAMKTESLVWWSPIAAGALSEDQLRSLSEEQRSALQSAIFGRPGISSTEEIALTSRATNFTPNFALTAVLISLFLRCYVLVS